MVILRSLKLTEKAFLNHFNYVKDIYGTCLVVNLVSEKKENEKIILENFEKLVI